MKPAHVFSPATPIPPHFNPASVDQVWRVHYEERAREARAWAMANQLPPVADDRVRLGLILIDVQNTFCLPDFELFVAGRSGSGAVDDNRRLCEFLYRNLGRISAVTTSLDTHQALQIFHAAFLVDDLGNHPDALSLITAEDITRGKWKFNPALAESLGVSPGYGQDYLQHYTRRLQEIDKYALTVWPYHAMLGGIGHALVSAVEEALFFHAIARYSQPEFVIKGNNPFTEAYSAVGPEILSDQLGQRIAQRSSGFLEKVRQYDAVIIAGQAKSHCVAWTVSDLLTDIQSEDPSLASKVYLLEDCTSPVVVPNVVDFSEEAEAAFQRFAAAGMHLVRSTDPLESWPGLAEKARA